MRQHRARWLPNRTLRGYAHSPLTPGQVRRLIPLSRRQRKEKDGDKSPDPPHSGRNARREYTPCIRDSAFGIHRSRLYKCVPSFPSHGDRRKVRRVSFLFVFAKTRQKPKEDRGTPAARQREEQPNQIECQSFALCICGWECIQPKYKFLPTFSIY